MRLFYQGTDITEKCIVKAAEYRDVSGGRMDSLDIRFAEPGKWESWGVKENDRVRAIEGSLDTGELYVAAAGMDGGEFRILATALKACGKAPRRNTYIDKTLKQIVSLAAWECGMGWRIFGLEENILYPYVQREKETAAAFLERLGRLEGAALKTYSGRLTMIGIGAAQELSAIETLKITPGMDGVRYIKNKSSRLAELKAKTPFLTVSAFDSDGQGGGCVTVHVPALDAVTAGRWARGLLLWRNRQAETLEIECQLRGSWTAMARIDVTGGTGADGEWMVKEVTHDLVEKRTRAELCRVIRTVK